ncbi:hypothetical protein [Pseudomonas sp. DCA-1]
MEIFDDPSEKAAALLHRLGVHEVSSGVWAFTDVDGKRPANSPSELQH